MTAIISQKRHNQNANVHSERNIIALIYCDACGGVHAVNFANEKEFYSLYCKSENLPVFCSKRRAAKVYREVQADIFKEAIAV
jgi:hypothetical protein